ncbi:MULTISPECIES: glycosyltransferase family 2 protein [Calothrix]|uniref:glycosyltransferase family 2 protein n=1 Tax=Calothrix TaxID=1186 RepID=UPI0018EFFFEB|nr:MULTISPECIES: glycosyltransferase family 2 protein [Calothrix]
MTNDLINYEVKMNHPIQPLVSAVIPTKNRPSVVTRAVKSVLQQTFWRLEVVVVVDGPDPATAKALQQIDDPRLRVLVLPNSIGGAAARNAGVAMAEGEWIAFLDDDDEWLPQKIQLQIDAANRSQAKFPIIACSVIAHTPHGEFIHPRRFPEVKEPLSEYILVRNSPGFGEGLIQTSGIFTSRELLRNVPFRDDLRKHQDWDWLLRVANLEGVEVQFVTEPLAIWYHSKTQKSVSNTHDWQYSLNWIKENRSLVTRRAYASFIMVEVGAQASAQGKWQEFLPLLWEAIRYGSPKPIDFLLCLGFWLVPRNTRRWLKGLLGEKQNLEQPLSTI